MISRLRNYFNLYQIVYIIKCDIHKAIIIFIREGKVNMLVTISPLMTELIGAGQR